MAVNARADKSNAGHVGAPMPGTVIAIKKKQGQTVKVIKCMSSAAFQVTYHQVAVVLSVLFVCRRLGWCGLVNDSSGRGRGREVPQGGFEICVTRGRSERQWQCSAR